MGFFDFFKKKEMSVLGLPDKFGGGFIQPLANVRLEVTLGQKIKVAPNWWAVIVLKDKPQDIFDEGEHELIIPNLPNVTKALKLNKSKVVKKGGKQELVFQNKFKCDIYFVNKQAITNQFWQTNLINKKIKGRKRFNVMMSGTFDFQSVDAKRTISLFLLEWAKIDAGKAQRRLLEYMNEFATEALDWCKCSAPQELDDKENAAKLLLPKIEKNFNKYGIQISNFKVDKVDFGREVAAMLEQEKLEKNIASDEINELGAEISLEDKEVEELVPAGHKKAEVQEKGIDTDLKPVVLDMSADESAKLFEEEQKPAEPVEKKSWFQRVKEKFISKDEPAEDEETNINEPEKIDLKNVDSTDTSETEEEKSDTETKTDAEILREQIKKGNSTPKDEPASVEIESGEQDVPEDKKICPKCKKLHDADDTVCDCGCILD